MVLTFGSYSALGPLGPEETELIPQRHVTMATLSLQIPTLGRPGPYPPTLPYPGPAGQCYTWGR